MVSISRMLLLLTLLAGSVCGISYDCAAPDPKEVKGVCVVKGVMLVSSEAVANASFSHDTRSGAVKMVDGRVPTFSRALARKLANVTDLTVDGMGIRDYTVWANLEHLSAQRNNISLISFEASFPEEQFQLRTLHLQNNALTGVPTFGKRFNQLKVLALDGNRLEVVALGSFTHLTQLQTLSIASNRLIEVVVSETPGPVVVQPLKLKHLSLANNLLLTLNVTGWEMESLESLDLSGNDLYLMDVTKLNQFRALKDLRYAGNDWNCEWLSAVQLYLRDTAISVRDRDVEGRCEREKMTNLRGMCCYEPAVKDFSTDLFADRWDQLNELQRRYDLVRFAYDKVEEEDLNAIAERAYELRAKLSGPVANGQDAIESTLRRLRSTVGDERAHMERLTAGIGQTVADVRQSIDELYQRSIRPKPTLDAVLQATATDSLKRIEKNIELLRRRIQDYVYEISVCGKGIGKLEARIASFENTLADRAKRNRMMQEHLETLESDATFLHQLIDENCREWNCRLQLGSGLRNPLAKYVI